MIYSLLFCAGIVQAHAQAGFQRTAKGAAYRIITPNAGPKIKANDVVTFHVTQKTDKDSVLFSSYAAGHPVQIQVQPSQNVADLMEIFPLLAVNDSVQVKVPADSVFKENEAARPPFLGKGSFINYTIKVVKTQTMNEAMAEMNAALEKRKQAEVAEAAKYITDNKLAVRSTASGLKYRVTQPTAKRRPVAGDTVLVNYTGKLLNGHVFDSSIQSDAMAAGLQQPGRTYEPIEVVVGKGQVIAGWDEGLQLLNEGAKATLIIPSNLGYGSHGAGEIPPYSTLVFDVELVKVKPAKHIIAKPAATKAGTHTTTRSSAAKKVKKG